MYRIVAAEVEDPGANKLQLATVPSLLDVQVPQANLSRSGLGASVASDEGVAGEGLILFLGQPAAARTSPNGKAMRCATLRKRRRVNLTQFAAGGKLPSSSLPSMEAPRWRFV